MSHWCLAVLVHFEIKSLCPGLVWTDILLFYFSLCSWDDRYAPPCPSMD
jgi:hypothetical protein